MSRIAIYDATYDASQMKEVMNRVFDDFPLPVKGKKVLVKPNILGPFEIERAITTHPSVVSAIVKCLEERGADIRVGDNPGMRGYGANLDCAKISGIFDAANGHYVNISEDAMSINIDSRIAEQALVSRAIMEADIYISVPKFKTHVSTILTGGIKNNYGILVGGQKANFHRQAKKTKEFAEMVVDVYNIRQPDLVIMDAVVGMEGAGPSSADLRDIGKIMASDDGVAMDTAMAVMMGIDPCRVPTLCVAEEKGLGSINPGDLEVQGTLEAIPDFKLPSTFLGTTLARLLTYIMVSNPVVNNEKCEECKMCAKHCPAGAIKMDPYPIIDKKKCFSCFCCHEFCKYNAMDVKKRIKFVKDRMEY